MAITNLPHAEVLAEGEPRSTHNGVPSAPWSVLRGRPGFAGPAPQDEGGANSLTLPERGRLAGVTRLFVALGLVAALLAAPPDEAAAEETIERFVSDVAVERDGTLRIAETIRVRAEGRAIRRGIYRDFPLTFEDADGAVREVGFRLLGVTRDGEPEPHFTERHGESIRIYAGEESVFLEPGPYTYVLTYETDRQIRWFEGRPELYWNVTGNAWAFPILTATARLTLPGNAAPVRWTAYTGPFGARGADWRGAVGGDGLLAVETTRPLAPGEGLSIVAEIQADAVDEPSGTRRARYFLRDYRGWIIGGLGLLAVLGYYAAAWNAVGRDPKGGTIIPLFHPPEGVSPALANYIHNWGYGANAWRAFTAAALSLAVRGLLLFDEEKKGELTLERTSEQPKGGYGSLPPGERAVLQWVEEEGGRAAINKANGKAVAAAGTKFKRSVEAENRGKFFRRNTLWFIGGLALTIVVFVLLFALGGVRESDLVVLVPVFIAGVFLGVFVVPLMNALLRGRSSGIPVRAALTLVMVAAFLVFAGGQFLAGLASSGYGLLPAILDVVRSHPLPIALVLVFPALNGLFLYLLRAPTALGRPVMDKLEGLRLYIETAESGRLNIAGAPDLTTERFEKLLPYAVALDVEKPWAEAFAAALARAHPGEADPTAGYHSRWRRGGSWSGDSFGRSVAASVAGATAAMAASLPRSSSGSSGFSGGGGSGGGGGGGGGGGW